MWPNVGVSVEGKDIQMVDVSPRENTCRLIVDGTVVEVPLIYEYKISATRGQKPTCAKPHAWRSVKLYVCECGEHLIYHFYDYSTWAEQEHMVVVPLP